MLKRITCRYIVPNSTPNRQ